MKRDEVLTIGELRVHPVDDHRHPVSTALRDVCRTANFARELAPHDKRGFKGTGELD